MRQTCKLSLDIKAQILKDFSRLNPACTEPDICYTLSKLIKITSHSFNLFNLGTAHRRGILKIIK